MTSKYNLTLLWVLAFSFLYSSSVSAQNSVKDTLTSKQNQTIYIGYGNLPSWKLTSAVSSIKGNNLTFSPNMANSLYAKLAGLNVFQGNTEPGNDTPGFSVRGDGTFRNNAPLIMVDGFESTLDQLTVEEIESVSVLKDASATAIYGSRGANGVILVTTKRGKNSPLKVGFSARLGFQSATDLPKFLGSYDYARLYNEALANDGKLPKYSEDDLLAYQAGDDPYFHPNVNWYNQVLRSTAPISNYNLNFTGGDDIVHYYVLLNMLNSEGLYKKTGDMSANSINSNYSRYNFRANVEVKLSNNLKAELILGGSVEDKSNPAGDNTWNEFSLLSSLPPNAFPVYNPDGTFGGNSTFSNPLGNLLETGFNTFNGRTLQSTFKLTEQLDFITKGLSISGLVSFNNSFRSYSSKAKTYQRFSISTDGTQTYYAPFGQSTSLVGDESVTNQWRNYAIQSFLNYDRSFGIHDINAMMMFNSDNYTVSGSNLPYKHVGIGGRFTYTLNKKYIGEFSFGYDGSENFPKDKRYGFFPAGSLGWVISNEDFLKNNTLLTFLKLRASYGLVGNDNIGGTRFMFDTTYGYNGGYYFGSTNTKFEGMIEGAASNTNVTWEKDKKANFGIEATLFNQLNVSIDIFNNDRYDILATPYSSIPLYMGMVMPMLNVGKVNNKGFEAIISYNSKPSKTFSYFVEASLSSAINNIIYNDEAVQLYDYQYRTGHPIGQPFGLEAIGFFKDQADIDASPKQTFTTVKPGDLKYKDQNGDKIIDDNDNVPIGKTGLPDLTLGLHGGIKFMGFDLAAMLQGVTGRTVSLSGYNFFAFQNNGQVGPIALGRWTPETAETATYPRLSADNNQNNYRYSSFWQRDGSFLKLRTVELGYSLPTALLKQVHIESARVFANAENLLCLDYINGYDAEVLSGYPPIRTISCGVKIQF